jgi:hypothetical protein
MKAVAKKLTTTTESAFVQSFVSKPVLRYNALDPANQCAGTGRSYSFVDCVSKFGDLVHDRDLSAAYKRAGSTFQGAMEQYFVVLREVDDRPIATGSNRDTLGRRGGLRGALSARGVPSRKRVGDSLHPTPSKRRPRT